MVTYSANAKVRKPKVSHLLKEMPGLKVLSGYRELLIPNPNIRLLLGPFLPLHIIPIVPFHDKICTTLPFSLSPSRNPI